jgi:hypothetical protein
MLAGSHRPWAKNVFYPLFIALIRAVLRNLGARGKELKAPVKKLRDNNFYNKYID